ncbi:MAG: AraC family transcriptional regulator, partial [Muribaculaceae bacterium]|nr:AraC family transcriptional regulator [Muribaculaceae bacterium]
MSEILNLAELVEKVSSEGSEVFSGSDYILRHIVPGEVYFTEPSAIRIDGLSIILCTAGEENVTINFRTVKLTEGCVMVLSPNDLVELGDSSVSNFEGYALFLPIEFLKLISLDSNTLNYKDINLDTSPILYLDGDKRRLLEGFYKLLMLNTTVNSADTVYTRNVSRSLVGALIYQLLATFRGQPDKPAESEETVPGASRRRYYVRDFMSLLQQDFRQHRSVGHYADKLFISAKYLSLIIKEATGRTATEWIDHFVILEAKNLLRYSGRNIQQIAYDLNFHNQSAFGKYFNQITGLSPSEFRNT